MSDFQKIMNTLLVFPFCCMFVIVPLQWGYANSGVKDWEISYPVSFSNNGIPLVSKVGSSSTNTELGLMGNKNNFEIHQSQALTTLMGIYWVAIGK